MNRSIFLLLVIILLSFSLAIYSQNEDWKKFESTMAAFSVEYPADWELDKKEASGKIWRMRFVSPKVDDYDVQQFSAILICSKPKGSSLKKWCRQKDDHLNERAKDKVLSDKTFENNGLKIRRKETEDKWKPRFTYIYAFVTSKEREYIFVSSFPRGYGLAKYIPVFDKMLESFKALPETAITIYKNDKVDFAMTYPDSWKNCSLDQINYNPKEEPLLKIVPKNALCVGDNFVMISRMMPPPKKKDYTQLQNPLSIANLKKLSTYNQFGNIYSSVGEKVTKQHIYRERYFYTAGPLDFELLKMSEKYEAGKISYQMESNEFINSARSSLKILWFDGTN